MAGSRTSRHTTTTTTAAASRTRISLSVLGMWAFDTKFRELHCGSHDTLRRRDSKLPRTARGGPSPFVSRFAGKGHPSALAQRKAILDR